MPFVLGDRIKETTTTTGTGALTLAGAATGYRSFASVLSVGDTTWYTIALGADWEVGLGTLTAATTLQRTTVLASSNGGALTSFGAGSKEVFVTTPGAALQQLQALRTSFRNRIINGNFAINQRGVASASNTYGAGAGTLDRWKAGSGNVAMSWSAAANGDVTPTVTGGTLVQVIEGALYLPEGGSYVLSWTGTATARVYQGSASGAYASSPVVVTLTAGTNATVEFAAGTIGLVQLEPGTVATAFERRDDELRRCQRYYYAYNPPGGVDYLLPAVQGGSVMVQSVKWPVPMRAAPTVAITAGTTGTFASGSPYVNGATATAGFLRGDTTTTGQYVWLLTLKADADL